MSRRTEERRKAAIRRRRLIGTIILGVWIGAVLIASALICRA